MDLYTQLSLQPVRTEPDVWVRRLTIYEQIAPEPKVIRDIPLVKGLNIVWAEESEDDNSTAEIAGHSAGKTTFCRLLRYVLGEKTYGTKANMEMIQCSLPNGYVGAELFVRHQLWAVIRPIGNGRNSYIKSNSTIEELIAEGKRPAYLESYPRELGLDALLDNLESAAIVSTGKPIEWGHLLAWCSRDQEARFQDNQDWRSPRSESEWPNVHLRKTDRLFIMRCVLGLFLPDELKSEEELSSLLRDRDRLERRLEDLKREPQFRINLYDNKLRRCLRVHLPNNAEIDTLPHHSNNLLPDLHRLAENVKRQIDADISSLELESKSLQYQIDEVGGQINHIETEFGLLATWFKLEDNASRELDNKIERHQAERDLFNEHREKVCQLGWILYQDCKYVQQRQASLRVVQLKDVREKKEAEARRSEVQRNIDEQKRRLNEEMTVLREKREALQKRRSTLSLDALEKRDSLRALQDAEQQLEMWSIRHMHSEEFRELQECQLELEATAKKIETTKTQLDALLQRHADNRAKLSSIFSGAVKCVLKSDTYDGSVTLSNRELAFRILHGLAMSGEAVETLSVLLADVSCLVYTSVSENAHLPGILLHDSPREADLGLRLYRSFIRFVASLEQHFDKQDTCPFQYIITTTTPPPEELQTNKHLKLRLDASRADGLLFGRSLIDTVDKSPQLFDE